jgi:hypothetical protein
VLGRVAILFWFYRDVTLCRNRLDLLRRESPDAAIYGLYGGPAEDVERFRSALESHLDDFWAFDAPVSSKWKWLHGDLMLVEWFEARGHELDWDHVFIAQWDMLILGDIADLLPKLAPDEVLLSGVVPVRTVEPAWVWTRGGHAHDYEAFLDAVRRQYGDVEPMSCLFVIACLPRRLFELYGSFEGREAGYLEYRLPTLAAAGGLRMVEDERYAAWRPADAGAGKPSRRQQLLNGSRRAVLLPTILRERARTDGARIFHPYHGLYPASARWALQTPAWAAYAAARAARQAVKVRLGRARDRGRVRQNV